MQTTQQPILRQLYTQIEQLPATKLPDLLSFVAFLQYQSDKPTYQQGSLETELQLEFDEWEQASDEAWLNVEHLLKES